MKRFVIRGNAERGQMLPLVALSAAVLIALIGLSIDLGFAYVTKARLSKACDAAALAGMENINLGTVTAKAIGMAEFYANYAGYAASAKKTSLDMAPVTPTFTFTPNTSAATQLTVSANTTIQTFFLKVLPALGDAPWGGVAAGDAAAVSRGHLDFTLVLDRSTSLANNGGNGGQGQMYPAVTNFLGFFSDVLDKAALVTFATSSSIDQVITNPFTSAISSKVYATYVNGTGFGGYTDGADGLTNALLIEGPIPIPTTSNLVKAVIFFTDGHMNVLQNTLNCSPAATLNFTPGDTGNNIYFYPPNAGPNTLALGFKDVNGNGYCPSSASFPSLHAAGGTLSFAPNGAYNVRSEAEDRCITWASNMRANKIVVCTIGLGNDVDTGFLQIVANDPAYPGLTPTPYDGVYVAATNATDMVAAFQTVAETLLLRLIR